MILDRSKFPELARRILAVPEADLARADKRVTIDLAIACHRGRYLYGAWFLQMLALRARYLDDCQLQRRTKELVETLRAQVWTDAGKATAELRVPSPPFGRHGEAPDPRAEEKLRLARAI